MWNGHVTFGDLWAAYVGPADQNEPHAHVALQLAVGDGGDVTVRHPGTDTTARGVLIRPLVQHALVSGPARVALLYVEAEAPLGRALLAALGNEDVAGASPTILSAVHGFDDPAASVARLESALAVAARPPLDARIVTALAVLGDDDGGSGAVRRAADAAGLSPARLRALAQQELGVPLSRWLLWRKLARASRAVAGGAALAAAAVDGGFADQAHFARTMLRMFGITAGTASASLR